MSSSPSLQVIPVITDLNGNIQVVSKSLRNDFYMVYVGQQVILQNVRSGSSFLAEVIGVDSSWLVSFKLLHTIEVDSNNEAKTLTLV